MFELKETPGTAKLRKVLKELSWRWREWRKALAVGVGREILKRVGGRFKPKFWWQGVYKRSLKVAYLESSGVDAWVGVYGDRPVGVGALDAERQLIWFKETRIKGKEKLGDFLREFQPWTVDLLPALGVYPARAVVRQVPVRTVIQRRMELRGKRREIEQRIKDLGVKVKRGSAKLRNKATFDLEYAVLAQEFRRGGKPIWRPVIREFPRIVRRQARKLGESFFIAPRVKKVGRVRKLNEGAIKSLTKFTSKIVGRPLAVYK